MNTREKPVVLAFDEFQQITEYPEKTAESLQEKELLLTLESKEKQEYQVYDVFLSRWLEWEF